MNVRAVVGALVIFAMIVGGIGVAAAVIARDPAPPTATRTPPPLTPPPPKVPTVAEFTVAVVVTDQQCAPGAGCTYKYTISPKYIGLHPLPEKEFTVLYDVTGGNQPQPGKFTVKKDQASILKDVTLEGPPGAQLRATVKQVVG